MEHITTLTDDEQRVIHFLMNEIEDASRMLPEPVGLYITSWMQALSFGLFGYAGMDELTRLIVSPNFPKRPDSLSQPLDEARVTDAQALAYGVCFQLWQALTRAKCYNLATTFLDDANKALRAVTRRFFAFVGYEKRITDSVNAAVADAVNMPKRFEEFRQAAIKAGDKYAVPYVSLGAKPAPDINPLQWLTKPDETIN